MSGVPFHQTPMGYAFITKTAPQAVRELGRLADGLERLNALLELFLAAQRREPVAKPDDEEDSP
jgi:hypothetical protein